jgi:hypothetical protein
VKPVCIFGPDGRPLLRTVGESRKGVRRDFARVNRCKWNDLWRLGFRVGAVRESFNAK